jgi:uncharacterized RDD family membrane protein YckC
MTTPQESAESPWRRPGEVDPAAGAVPKEARNFQGHRAGIVTKVLANSIDLGVVVIAVAGLYAAVAATKFIVNPRAFTPPSPSFARLLLIGWLLLAVYFWLSWATTGRTYGDHLLGLRVVSWRGYRMRWIPALVRAAFCASFMPGLFWTVISRQNRSVQDVVLRSSVIYDWEVAQPALRHDEVPNEARPSNSTSAG